MGAEDRKDKAEKREMVRKRETETDGGNRREKDCERGLWVCRYIIEEIEQQEAERRQELAEKAVTRVLLMCNENPHRGRDDRKDRRMDGGR